MKLRFILFSLIFVSAASVLKAQHLPIYHRNSEISGLGYFNQGRAELNLRYGHYIDDFVQMGFYVDFQDSSFYTRTGLGALFIRSFDTPTYVIPYVGAGLGYGNLDRGSAGKSGVELSVLVGLRYFIANNVSLNSELHAAISTDDSFVDNSKAESMNMGIRFGLAYSW